MKPSLPRRTPQAENTSTAKVQEAVDARDDLAAALKAAGIQLPAMDVRTPWRDGEERARPADYALVHLGICSAPVAHALAGVIRKGAAG
ncbi:hypothetical protein [Streptomyces sp. SID9727]|uniref:hypothetical protein n=1 Tax=Streptomyces sp. SID9727 TaxID=2706114 RepID=UPI0013C862F4|nr:hypothetical protein [Streptomyces sp. SID9727]NEC68441.1 hypothetical protein [Streptomyces sp. SID9727]